MLKIYDTQRVYIEINTIYVAKHEFVFQITYSSAFAPVNTGVPQDLVLGGILFSM